MKMRVWLHGLIILSIFLSLNVSRGKSAPFFDCTTVTEIPQPECEALEWIYLSTGGSEWTNHDNWFSTITPSNWAHVTVTDNHVTRLNLMNNHLVGFIPEQIGDLPELTYLDMGDNQLSGTIPTTFGKLVHLTDLYLWENALTGSVPSELGKLSSLRYLNFWSNQLNGSLPSTLGGLSQLIELVISQNHLTGEIPSSYGDLTHLSTLAFYDNALSGDVPNLSKLTDLTGLYLNNNQLSGNILSWIGSLTKLSELQLMANQFTGEIQPEIGNLTDLTWIGLRGNKFTGSIPPEFGNLTKLTVIDFRHNYFSGTIPVSIGNLIHLTALHLEGNQFTGAIPHQIGNLTDLTELGLDHNLLSGSPPEELVNLTHLVGPHEGAWGADGLALDYNHLTVPVPYPADPPTALQSLLLVKDPSWQFTQTVDAAVTAAGGELTSHDSTATITVPSGAVTTTTTLEYVPQAWPTQSPSNFVFANRSFQLQALDSGGTPIDSFTFLEPVTITIQYTQQDIQTLMEGSVLLYYWDTSTHSWKDASTTCTPNTGYLRDSVNHTLTVSVCHFTEFALLGNTELKFYLPVVQK